jgi:hypothetical protein
MSVSRELLANVPLITFLDAYAEPAFILCSNTSPHSSLDFVFGNSALHALLFGHDDSGVLNGNTFFAVLASDDDLFWLSDPVRGRSRPTSVAISVRPTWLPRDHTPIDLELTPTPIDLPMTIPGVGSTSRSFVFTASPRKAPMNLLRSEPHAEPRRRRDSALRLPDFPPPAVSVGQRLRSRQSKSKSESTSWPSQPGAIGNTAELPSKLFDTFPWETTSLGPRESWPVSLKLMVKYLLEKPIPVSSATLPGLLLLTAAQSSILWGWPEYVSVFCPFTCADIPQSCYALQRFLRQDDWHKASWNFWPKSSGRCTYIFIRPFLTC